MSTFPQLKTGAVIQYPASREIGSSTQVVTFLDGSEQRYRERATSLRRWVIRLDLLDEEEVRQIEEFFISEQGRFGNFTFTDPWDDMEFPNCSLESDEVAAEFREEGRGSVAVVVRQNAV